MPHRLERAAADTHRQVCAGPAFLPSTPRCGEVTTFAADEGNPANSGVASLISAIPDAMIVVDLHDIVRFVNPAALGLMGRRYDELVGEQLGFAVTPDAAAEIEIIGNDGPLRAQLRVVDCIWNGAPALLAIMRDVSVQAELEDRLESERALGERRLREALHASSAPILLVDAGDRIVMANRAAGQLFGYPDRGLAGQPLSLILEPALSVARFPASGSGGGFRHRAIRRNGGAVPVEIGFTHFEDRTGSVVMLSISDVTQLVAQEQSLREQNLELARLNQELTQFAYSVSHDLKAPMTTVTGLLELGIEDIDRGDLESCREMLGNALDTCRRNASKIEAVLEIARAGREPAHVETVDVAAELRLIWADLAGPFPGAPRLMMEVSGTPRFRTERQTMLTIFENLLSNALRFSDASKPDSRVTLRGGVEAGVLRIEVADNGIGIPADLQDRVFGMFNRFSDRSGSGLGLALVKKHVDRLKGEIGFQSDAGGTRFTVTLPRIEGPAG